MSPWRSLTMLRRTHISLALLLLLSLFLSACSTSRYSRAVDGAPSRSLDPDRIADAVPRSEPRSRYGNPASYVERGRRYTVMQSARGYVERGVASWYGAKFHGHRTSSGETYDMYAMTAAHRTLPLPSYVLVTNLENNRRAVVRVNDRGPFHDNRIIDLSYAAAVKLGITATGTGMVEVRAIDPDSWRPGQPVPSPAPAGGSYRLYVQAGAFTSRVNAERLKHRLDSIAGHHPVHMRFSSTDRLYRVHIGPVSSVEAADRLAERISALGIARAHVVVD